MTGNRAVVAAVVGIALALGGWWVLKRGAGASSIDLIPAFDTAKKQPGPELFSVADETLGQETMKAILMQPTAGTRLTFKVRVPDDAWLRVSVGLKPEAWDKPGDGVKFLVGVSDGRTFEQLFTHHVDPFVNKSDRRWIPVTVDLSAFAGEEVDLMFNTYSSIPGKPENHDNDLALWGAPLIFVR